MYVFTDDQALLQQVILRTSCGGILHNDILQQYSCEHYSALDLVIPGSPLSISQSYMYMYVHVVTAFVVYLVP